MVRSMFGASGCSTGVPDMDFQPVTGVGIRAVGKSWGCSRVGTIGFIFDPQIVPLIRGFIG